MRCSICISEGGGEVGGEGSVDLVSAEMFSLRADLLVVGRMSWQRERFFRLEKTLCSRSLLLDPLQCVCVCVCLSLLQCVLVPCLLL